MQVMPWSALQKEADGYDHDFLFQGDHNWLLRAYCMALRVKWRRAHIDVVDRRSNKSRVYRAPKIPWSFPKDGRTFIFRDRSMIRFADRHGNGSDSRGESYISVFIFPHQDGTHLDVVTAEPLPHPFTKWAVGTFVELIGWWYHIRFGRYNNETYGRPPGRTVVTEDTMRFVGRGGRFIQTD